MQESVSSRESKPTSTKCARAGQCNRVLDVLGYCFGQLPCSWHNVPWYASMACTVCCPICLHTSMWLSLIAKRHVLNRLRGYLIHCIACLRLRLFVTCTLIVMVPEAPLVQTERLMPVMKPASAAWEESHVPLRVLWFKFYPMSNFF